MSILYTYINGEKKYLMMPKTIKPSYWIARDTKTGTDPSYRTYYRVYLDGTTTNETFTYNYGYTVGSASNNPLLFGHKFDNTIQKTIIYNSNCNTVSSGNTYTMYYKIYDADMNQVKEFNHSITYPSATPSSTYNNEKHLLLTLFSGYISNTGELNPRYLRIIDLVNLRMLTKSFTWPNGNQSEVIKTWYNSSTQKLRILCKNYATGASSQAMGICVYDVNLTSDEYDINPIFTYTFTEFTTIYYIYIAFANPYSWDSPIIGFNPCAGTATINGRTRPVGNMFYYYDFRSNTITSISRAQTYTTNGTDSAGGIITSPDENNYVLSFLKWNDLSELNTNLFRWSTVNGLTTPTSSLGNRYTNACFITSWNKKYCLGIAGSDSTSGVGKAAIYWTDNNNNYNYYNPTIYEATSGNPISSTSTGSIGTNTSSTKYLAINKRENTSNPVKYINVIDCDDIQTTIKLDLTTNTAFANDGWNSWSGFFTY